MGKILVTGGCGYLGSHTLVDLLQAGYACISVDNYLNSDPQVLDQIFDITGQRVHNYAVDVADKEGLKTVFEENDVDAIIHFAALKAVGESVERPLLYYRNNVFGMIHIMECALYYDVPHLIFSSSCTVYGNAKDLPVREDTRREEAESPYGYTKQICERIIEDSIKGKAMRAVMLRYFNPAGAHESLKLGESPINPPLNLVPIITEVGMGVREELKVFGDDYATRDGSCIRDYIHVMDLADAHTKALQFLEKETLPMGETEVYNLGTGKGTTVLEAIAAWEKVSNKKLPFSTVDRRAGDIPEMFANYDKAKRDLGWDPKRDIESIMESAWGWEQLRSQK